MRLSAVLRERLWTKFKAFIKKNSTLRVLAVLLFIVPMFFIIYGSASPQYIWLHVDEVATKDVVAETNVVIVDHAQTAELRQQAADAVQKIYKQDQEALRLAQDNVSMFFAQLIEIGDKNAATEGEGETGAEGEGTELSEAEQAELRANQLRQYEALLEQMAAKAYSPLIDAGPLAYWLLYCSVQELELMEAESLRLMDAIMDKAITEEALDTIYGEVSRQVELLNYSAEAKEIVNMSVASAVQPNLVYDDIATQEAIQEAIAAVQPVQKTVKAGEIIVRSGDRVTAEQISVLEQVGLQRSGGSSMFVAAGILLLLLLLLWLTRTYIKRNHAEIYERLLKLLLIVLVALIVLVISHLLDMIQVSDVVQINSMTGYLAPIAAGSMLIAVLLNPRLAYFITMMLAILVGLMANSDQLSFVLVAFIGGSVGIYYTSNIRQTSDMAKSAVYIALANVLTIIALLLLKGGITLNVLLTGILMGASNGLLSAILMIGALPYLEAGFGVISMIRMLELCNPNQALLKRLMIEAPGTYHHSVMVGNLAEATAEVIGANPMLARLGSYYHDIGKVRRPEYFVENQQGMMNNPHENIAPALSALILTSHVKEGAEMAREARLPETVIDFIRSHHGTSLISYFYNIAVNEDGDGNVNESSFRYEGPRPRSKEAALVMLADSVEAAVRSLPDPTMEKIDAMVYRIIMGKLNDGQLDECNLTFRDLDMIRGSFCKVLAGIYHKRIEYPDQIKLEVKAE
ncbi:MAG: HDIG domain-containing protein [Syntrophomonadaceae bacterium]|nr:HDIG domain-containing protein [Syntrophomonadaceae bacterium]